MKTVAILSQKGGSGKTTLSLHLAVAAVKAGKSAVVVDLDPQASATTWYAARKKAGHSEEPPVVPTHPAQLETLIDNCRAQSVDFVFVDTAPQSDNLAVQAAQLSDVVLVTCKPSVMDLRAIQSTLRLTDIAGVTPHVVLSQIEPQGERHAEAAATLAALNVDVCPIGTVKRVAYMDALIEGQTAQEYEPNGKAAVEVNALYQHVLKLAAKNNKRARAA